MKALLASKKGVACAVGLAAVIASIILGKLGVAVPEERIQEIAGIIVAYILGQGISDHGKAAAEIHAGSGGADPPAPPTS